jgi:small subunit ribosomal protein S18
MNDQVQQNSGGSSGSSRFNRGGGRFSGGGSSGGGMGGGGRKPFMRQRRKVCFFCANPMIQPDYKDVDLMARFIADRGKILPRRNTGACAKHQRKIAIEIKRAREIALLPYIVR